MAFKKSEASSFLSSLQFATLVINNSNYELGFVTAEMAWKFVSQVKQLYQEIHPVSDNTDRMPYEIAVSKIKTLAPFNSLTYIITFSEKQWQSLREDIRKKAPTLKPTNDFFYKSLRGDIYNYFYRIIKELIDPQNKFPKRLGEKKNFTVTGDGIFSRIPHETYPLKTPQYTKEEKKGFTNFQAMSLGMIDCFPPIFGFNKRKDLLAGILLDYKNILLSNRLFIYDGGTVGRNYDQNTINDAKSYADSRLQKKLFSKNQFNEFKNVVRTNKDNINESLVRMRWTCDDRSKIFIGSDNFESRLLATQYADSFVRALKAAGKCAENYQIPIIFYTPNDKDLLFKQYTYEEYLLDTLEAHRLYKDKNLRRAKYKANQYEFLFALSPEEIIEALSEKIQKIPLAIHLLKEGLVHIYNFLSEKSTFILKISLPQNTKTQNIVSSMLEHAARCNNENVVKIIIPEIQNAIPTQLIFQALKENFISLAQQLIDSKKCDLDKIDDDKETLLTWAIKKGNLAIVKLLIQCGANPKKMGRDVEPPIFLAAKFNTLRIVKFFLLQNIYKVDFRESKNWEKDTLLLYALKQENIKLAKLLLKHGANYKTPDRYGNTPFFLATKYGYVDIVKLLLKLDAHIIEEKLDTILCNVISGGHIELFDLLLDNITHIKSKYILLAIVNQQYKILVTLLSKYDQTKIKEAKEFIIPAVRMGFTNIVRLLLNYQVNIHVRENDDTPLMVAVKNNWPDTVELLCEYGVNTEEKQYSGDTALIHAAYAGNLRIVKMLLFYNANVEEKNNFGDTAVHCAIERNHFGTLQLLINNKANVESQNNDGVTPLMRAVKNKQTNMVKLLLESGAK